MRISKAGLGSGENGDGGPVRSGRDPDHTDQDKSHGSEDGEAAQTKERENFMGNLTGLGPWPGMGLGAINKIALMVLSFPV